MSGDSPKWLDELEQELGLGNTPAPAEPDNEIPVVDAIERIDFSPQGWARVRELIMRADDEPNTDLFRRIISASADDAFIFTAMIGLPYWLALTLGYDKKLSKMLATFVAASYVIAMRRGHALGLEDANKA